MLKQKQFLLILVSLLTLFIIYIISWLAITDSNIREKFANQTFSRPTQFYSSPYVLVRDKNFNQDIFLQLLQSQGYREKPWGSALQESDYSYSSGETCENINSDLIKCYAFYHHERKKIYLLGVNEQDQLIVLTEVNPNDQQSKPLNELPLFPKLFAQYVGHSPVIQSHTPLSHVPRACLDAALAVEDPQFLEHKGISWRGFFRALWVNIRQMRMAQGGSTITQQLVKNHFLSSERKISRKIKEMIIATLVELRIPKDEILETYLNIIYLGQQGNFQVRGYQAASRFYFQKDIEGLDLGECALLAAIINNPGLYNPFRKPENAKKRKEKVLNDMLEQNRILPEQSTTAMAAPLPTKTTTEIKETAPYFIDGIKQQLEKVGFSDLGGYKIYTTLNLQAQSQAQKAVQKHLANLEETSEYHKTNKAHSLQAVLIASDPQNGHVLALVGGRDHRKTPFNRVLDSSRQVGSIFKPFVYLTALRAEPNFTPLTEIENTKFVYEYDGQKWSPNNYDNTFSEQVPAFYALKESMNIPTARLGLKVGLDEVISTARSLGIKSELKAFPSLSLGAFELNSFEVAQAYTNIARFGDNLPLTLVARVEDQAGNLVYQPDRAEEQVLNQKDVATLVSMLKETMRTGTGQAAGRLGFNYDCAGKTGTTTGYKDAWFAGFTPKQVAVVWTGYDDNTPVKLSGASGALPIWAEYMKNMSTQFLNTDFLWPQDGQKIIELDPEEMEKLGIPPEKAVPTRLITFE